MVLGACLIGICGLSFAPAMADALNAAWGLIGVDDSDLRPVDPGLVSEFAISPFPGVVWAFDGLPYVYGRIDDSVSSQVEFGLQGRWVGLMRIEEAGIYRFRLNGDGDAIMSLDGLVVLCGADEESRAVELLLAPGNHPFRIDFSPLYGDSELSLLFAEGDADFATVPPSMLFHEIADAERVMEGPGVVVGRSGRIGTSGVYASRSSALKSATAFGLGDVEGVAGGRSVSGNAENGSEIVISYSYDADGRLVGCESDVGVSSVELSPAGNPLEIGEGRVE